MKSKHLTANNLWMLSLCCLLLLTAASCGANAGSPAPIPPGTSGAKDRNACHLLSPEEVSALVGGKIAMVDQVEADDTWSTCEWQDDEGTPLFWLTVYWEQGQDQWDAWRAAQGLGDAALEQAEGVGAGDMVQQGLVTGIGDAAYFSDLLPSLVLRDDVLFEMNLFFVPDAGSKFAGLARRLLETLD